MADVPDKEKSVTGFFIRAADSSDLDALVDLHVRVWRATYADLATPESLEKLDQDRRRPAWRAALEARGPLKQTIIAEREGILAGLVSFAPADRTVFKADVEIRHLYVDAQAKGTGIGRALLEAAFARLSAAEVKSAALAVVSDNHPARAFYKHMGGVEIGEFTDPGPLWRSHNIIVRWMSVR